MSLYTPRPSNADQPRTLYSNKPDDASEAEGQRREGTAEKPTGWMAGTGAGISADISATQKMISATWGSILTSLLGTMLHLARTSVRQAPDLYDSHTP
jgi:hypothetical protein